jgi:hypothetical protein
MAESVIESWRLGFATVARKCHLRGPQRELLDLPSDMSGRQADHMDPAQHSFVNSYALTAR